ncbi:hypothetical protein WJX79_006208 [Trebouxia sp. C0005]
MRPSSCNESKNLRAAAGAAEIVTKRNQLPAGRGRGVDVGHLGKSMQGSCGFREAKRGWQRTQESLGQACRPRHSRLMLLAPCLCIFLLLLWSPSVHPGLSNASAAAQKATSAAVETLESIRPSLILKSNSSSTVFSNTPPSPSAPASTDPTGSASQVHMGFNNTVIHDSYSSGNFSAVNSTDVVPISEMPDQDTPMSSSTPADWAQIIEDDPSDDPMLPTTSASAEKADSGSRTQDQMTVDPGMIHPTSRAFRAPGKFPVTRDDLVVAMPTDKRHFPIVEASRAWRKDIRTLVALANETVASEYAHFGNSSEVWGYYPDDEPLKGLHPGDSRAALTPFLAHEAFEGDYKWILYGDDDTFFFVDGVLELLQDFDPSLPYFITDHYWWGDELNESMNYHPHERAPRCLPCHWTQEDEERSLRADGYRPFQPYIGCPCTAERICKTDDRGFFDDACNMPVWKPLPADDFRVYTMHGGAGALMSIGLMERLPLSFMDRCMKDLARSSGGDALISVCLWRAGYAFTDPGYSFYHWEAKSFDPGPENSTVLLAYLEDATSNNSDQYSLELLTHLATSHLRPPPALPIGVGDAAMTNTDSRYAVAPLVLSHLVYINKWSLV